MNNRLLIFNWRQSSSEKGTRLPAMIIVTLAVVILFPMVNVTMHRPVTEMVKTASVLQMIEPEQQRIWAAKAEEQGPFPARLQLPTDEFEEILFYASRKAGWNEDYEISLRPLIEDDAPMRLDIALKGLRFYPERKKLEKQVEPKIVAITKRPAITVFQSSNGDSLPKTLPEFGEISIEESAQDGLRYLVEIDGEGKVRNVLPTNGAVGEISERTSSWLEQIVFARAEVGSQWIGLQVDFINEVKDES